MQTEEYEVGTGKSYMTISNPWLDSKPLIIAHTAARKEWLEKYGEGWEKEVRKMAEAKKE